MGKSSKLKVIVCDSWAELLTAVEGAKRELDPDDESLWFRGSNFEDHSLLPSLMRDTLGLTDDDHHQYEADTFFEFQARAAELRPLSLSDWDYLFYSRHHCVPTRVLDWTDTFGIALYFALDGLQDGDRPAIWIMNPCALNEETWVVRDIVQPKYLGTTKREYLDFGELLNDPSDWNWDGPIAVYPLQFSARVSAQRGWFTIHGNDRAPIDTQFPKQLVKLVLTRRCASECKACLKLIGITEFSIYPDLDRLGKSIRYERLAWADMQRRRGHN